MLKKLSINIEEDEHAAVKILAAKLRISIKDLVLSLVKSKLDELHKAQQE